MMDPDPPKLDQHGLLLYQGQWYSPLPESLNKSLNESYELVTRRDFHGNVDAAQSYHPQVPMTRPATATRAEIGDQGSWSAAMSASAIKRPFGSEQNNVPASTITYQVDQLKGLRSDASLSKFMEFKNIPPRRSESRSSYTSLGRSAALFHPSGIAAATDAKEEAINRRSTAFSEEKGESQSQDIAPKDVAEDNFEQARKLPSKRGPSSLEAFITAEVFTPADRTDKYNRDEMIYSPSIASSSSVRTVFLSQDYVPRTIAKENFEPVSSIESAETVLAEIPSIGSSSTVSAHCDICGAGHATSNCPWAAKLMA